LDHTVYCSVCGGREGNMDSLRGTSSSRSQLRRSDGRQLASRVSERLLAGPQLPLNPVHCVTGTVLHLLLQQSTRARQLPTRLTSRLLRDRLRCTAIVKQQHSRHLSQLPHERNGCSLILLPKNCYRPASS